MEKTRITVQIEYQQDETANPQTAVSHAFMALQKAVEKVGGKISVLRIQGP